MKGQPFLFDENIFDDDVPLTEEELAKMPEFSREEMEAARLSSFEEGKKAGFQESQESMTNTMMTLLSKIESDVSVLFASEEKRQRDYEQNATHLAAQIFSKAFPVYMEEHGLNEMQRAVREALSSNMVPENVQIEVNDAVFGPFTKLIEEHTETLQKQINFKSDPSLPEYACRISWPGGGLLCDRSALVEKIFNILNHSLAQQGVTLHDRGDSEKDENNNTADDDTAETETEKDEAETSEKDGSSEEAATTSGES